MALTKYKVVSTVTAAWPPQQAQLVNGGGGAVTTPAVPASATAQYNGTGQEVLVSITGGTVSLVQVNTGGGNVTAATSSPASVYVPANATITITYTVAPTWTWTSAPGAEPGPNVALVSSGPSLQTATWLAGQVIEMDPATAAGLALQTAIGASNLVAFTAAQETGGSLGVSN